MTFTIYDRQIFELFVLILFSLQCDSNIAKQLFSSIFQGIFSQLEENLTETQAADTFSDIQNALNNMLASSLQFFPPFISCVQVWFCDAKIYSKIIVDLVTS